MGYSFSRISCSEQLIVGAKEIAKRLGVSTSTVQRWKRWHGFPMARLPNGQVFTSPSLIDGWILARVRAEREAEDGLKGSGDASAMNSLLSSRPRTGGQSRASQGQSEASPTLADDAYKPLW